MKIALIHPLLRNYGSGGGEQINLMLAKELGADIYVVSADTIYWNKNNPNKDVQEWLSYGFKVMNKEIQTPILRKLHREIKMHNAGQKSNKWYKMLENYDVVIFGDDIRYIKLKHPRTIYYRHSLLPNLKIFYNSVKQSLLSADIVISNSDYSAKELRQKLGVESKVIYLPIKLEAKTIRQSLGYFVYAGRLEEEKGIGDLINKIKITPQKIFHIVGQGSLFSKLSNLGLDNIILHGALTLSQTQDIISEAEAYIHLGTHDAFGLAPIEAQSLGVPVIGYKDSVLEETTVNEISSILMLDNSNEEWERAVDGIKDLRNNSKKVKETTAKWHTNNFVNEIKKLF
jgi:glycosyltransferase involved in cell wall biosynthesis